MILVVFFVLFFFNVSDAQEIVTFFLLNNCFFCRLCVCYDVFLSLGLHTITILLGNEIHHKYRANLTASEYLFLFHKLVFV